MLDGSAFVLEKYGEWAFLAELGLEDALDRRSASTATASW